jgi:hypothetical protein
MTKSEINIAAIREANKQWQRKHGVSLSAGLMDYTKEDVEQEKENLEAFDHSDSEDLDQDESEVDMKIISPLMREVKNG